MTDSKTLLDRLLVLAPRASLLAPSERKLVDYILSMTKETTFAVRYKREMLTLRYVLPSGVRGHLILGGLSFEFAELVKSAIIEHTFAQDPEFDGADVTYVGAIGAT